MQRLTFALLLSAVAAHGQTTSDLALEWGLW